MILEGCPSRLGACFEKDGVNFALYSGGAEAVELCLYDAHRHETARHFLPRQSNGVWHGFLPGCQSGQRYGYRVHGPWSPEKGLRYNPAKLLIDPYARRLEGGFHWNPAVYDYLPDKDHNTGSKTWHRNERDSAPFVPLGVVSRPRETSGVDSPRGYRGRRP